MTVMEFQYPPDMNTRAGTVGGLTLVLLIKLDASMLMETVIVACIGAVVSFSVSVLLKWMIRQVKSGFRKV